MLPGSFAYAESWDDETNTYSGLAIEPAANAAVVVRLDRGRKPPGIVASGYWIVER